jgi:methionyl aminopeptidase
MTTDDIDRLVHEKIIANNAYPSPLHYMGFPKSVCTSINNVACHGIPDDRPLEDGDIINIDITVCTNLDKHKRIFIFLCQVYLHGHHGDCSETYMIGNVDEKGRELVKVTKLCLEEAIKACDNFIPFKNIGMFYKMLHIEAVR